MAPKGGKAALMAAGWQFHVVPWLLPSAGKHVRSGRRGTMVIPPAESRIEPRQFGKIGEAVAWAVEQSALLVNDPPIGAVAGMAGIRLMLGAALASGEICEGPDAMPARADAELLSICRDAFVAFSAHGRILEAIRNARDKREDPSLVELVKRLRYLLENKQSGAEAKTTPIHSQVERHGFAADAKAIRAVMDAVKLLPEFPATTREGLIQKARTSLLMRRVGYYSASVRDEVAASLAEDVLHLVPTLVGDSERSIPQASGTGKTA